MIMFKKITSMSHIAFNPRDPSNAATTLSNKLGTHHVQVSSLNPAPGLSS